MGRVNLKLRPPPGETCDSPRPRAVCPVHSLRWGLILVLVTMAGMLVVHSRLKTVELGYALSQALQENKLLLGDERTLQIEVATLRSPRRLRKVAMEELGLLEPRPDQIIKPDGTKSMANAASTRRRILAQAH